MNPLSQKEIDDLFAQSDKVFIEADKMFAKAAKVMDGAGASSEPVFYQTLLFRAAWPYRLRLAGKFAAKAVQILFTGRASLKYRKRSYE